MRIGFVFACILTLAASDASAVGPYPDAMPIGVKSESNELVYDCLVPVASTALKPGEVVVAVFQSKKFSETGTLELHDSNVAVFRPTKVVSADGKQIKFKPLSLLYAVRNEGGTYFVRPDSHCAGPLN